MADTLTKVSLRNVAAHKLRLALTVLAVVLGTAFLSGALMFTHPGIAAISPDIVATFIVTLMARSCLREAEPGVA